MELEIPNQNGLQPGNGRKLNIPPLGTPVPKPEIKITNPAILAQMPGPKPLSLEAAEEVKKWMNARGLAQNTSQQESFELSSDHRFYRFDQIDALRPTIYGRAAAVIFRYLDRTNGELQIVIVKLDSRADAILLVCAIAWKMILSFPIGQYVSDGTETDIKHGPPFDPGSCVDNYFQKQWLANANAKLAADRAAIAQPLTKANQRIAELDERIRLDECQRNATFATLIAAETKLKQEHDRAEFLSQLVSWFAGIIVIIVIIIFVVYVWRA
jgi:hypothetical protein